MPQLNIYIILSKEVPLRVQNSTRTLQWVKTLADGIGLPVKFHSLGQPDATEIEQFLKNEPTKSHFEKRLTIQEDLRNDPVYKTFIRSLTLQEVSNVERHRVAYLSIQNGNPQDFHLVLEDDFYVLPLMEDAWKEMLQSFLHQDAQQLPLVWFGIVKELVGSTPFTFCPGAEKHLTREHPLLPSKEAYLIHPTIAKELYNDTEFIQMDMRHTLSRWVFQHPNQPMFYPSKRIGFDGSKLGIYPSTLHPNNLLIFNKEYMDLLKLMNAGAEEKTKANICQKYKLIEKLKSPDAIHLYAVLLFQLKLYDDADHAFKEAIHEMVAQKGLLTRQSEMLHNAIEFYKYYQADEVKEYASKPSKYAVFLQASSASNASSNAVSITASNVSG